MKLQIGKRYLRRDGTITDPLEPFDSPDYPFLDPFNREVYTPFGRYLSYRTRPHYKDLVVEVV